MRRAAARAALVVAAVTATVACGMIAGIDDLTIGECKGGLCLPDAPAGDEEIELPVDDGGRPLENDGESGCPGKPSPPAVRVGPPDNSFCIDTTEVSNAQYEAFLDAKVDPGTQDPECRWNKTFAPQRAANSDAAVPDDVPVTYIDWCDAHAYCKWAGKYLCGKVEGGTKIGPVTLDGITDYKSHQWMLACSAEGRLRYPYGGLFDPTKCNVYEYDAGALLPVGSAPQCVGGYDGLHDLVGNAWEWYDGPCLSDAGLEVDGGDGGPASHGCYIKGGSYRDRGEAFDCRIDSKIRRDYRGANVGFRCCSE